MIRLVFHIILLAVVAVFVALNVPYTTTIDLFGYLIEDVSTVAVVLVSLIAGVVYSFIYYVLNLLRKTGVRRAKKKQQEVKEKEKLLAGESKKKGKKGQSQTPAGSTGQAASTTASSAAIEAPAGSEPDGSSPMEQTTADAGDAAYQDASGKEKSGKKKGGLFSKKKKKKD